jgi:hypothetical protein
MNYLNFYTALLIICDIRYTFTNYISQNQIVFYFILLVELVIQLIWIVTATLQFIEILILTILGMITILVFYVPISGNAFPSLYYAFAHIASLIVTVCFAFIYEMECKQLFYFLQVEEKKNNWMTNVLDNMNSGFIRIKDNSICYMNRFMEEKLIAIKERDFDANPRQTEGDCKR